MADLISGMTGIPREASNGFGGLAYILVADISAVDVTVDQTTGLAVITDVGESTTTTVAGAFKKFHMTKESSNITETMTGGDATGSISYAQVLTAVFHRSEAAKRNALAILAKSHMYVVGVDRNGDYQLLGADGGMALTSNVNTSGTVGGDLHGYTVTLSATEPFAMSYCDPATIAILSAI